MADNRPINIIAAAVHAAECGCGTPEQAAYDLAQVAVNALTDERITRYIYEILAIRSTYEVDGPDGLEGLVREVLRLVGEA